GRAWPCPPARRRKRSPGFRPRSRKPSRCRKCASASPRRDSMPLPPPPRNSPRTSAPRCRSGSAWRRRPTSRSSNFPRPGSSRSRIKARMQSAETNRAAPRGIGFYLVALILLAVVPLVITAGVLIQRQGELQREAIEKNLRQTSLAVSVAVDRQLFGYRVMLETLAESDELRPGRIPQFHALAARV